jgi:hypothetical protein
VAPVRVTTLAFTATAITPLSEFSELKYFMILNIIIID